MMDHANSDPQSPHRKDRGSLPSGSPSRRQLLKGMTFAGVPLLAGAVSGCGGDASAAENEAEAPPPPAIDPSPAVVIGTEPYSIAIVAKAASAAFNLQQGVDKLIGLMQEARARGARLMVCGELWLPGYPSLLNFQSDWKEKEWTNYVANSMTVGDASWQRILAAARATGIAVCFGFSELAGRHAYMAQVLIGDDGRVWNFRRKVRPSGAEREYWSDDVMAGNLNVVTTELGRISMLECWDHLRPQSTFNVMAQLPNVHICAWPTVAETTPSTPFWDRKEIAQTAAAYFSQLSGAVTVLTSVGYVGVYIASVQVAGMGPDDPEEMLLYTVEPGGWTGATGSSTSEFSYGVLQLLADSYPGERVADGEHGVLNRVPLPAV